MKGDNKMIIIYGNENQYSENVNEEDLNAASELFDRIVKDSIK